MFDLTTLAVVAAAYLIGSLSFAVIVSRVMGLSDPRSYGSKNPGATNVLRSGSKKAAIATLLLDGAKGWLPVWLVAHWGSAWGLGDGTLAALQVLAELVGAGKPASELLHQFDPVPQLLKNVRFGGGKPLEDADVQAWVVAVGLDPGV